MGKIKSMGINIDSYDSYSQAAVMLCPTNAKQAKITKFIDIMFKTRQQVDECATKIKCIQITISTNLQTSMKKQIVHLTTFL